MHKARSFVKVGKMNTGVLMLLILICIMSIFYGCIIPSKYKATYQLARNMWVSDPCGENKYRLSMGWYFITSKHLDGKIKREKDIIKYLGTPDTVLHYPDDDLIIYEYFTHAGRGCTNPDRIEYRLVWFDVYVYKKPKEEIKIHMAVH
jgi:hypothetical protein